MADASTTLTAPLEAIKRLGARGERQPSGSASFPELVWAHFLRQQEVQKGNLHGPSEAEYRNRLAAFEAAEGRLLNAYWCTTEASAVALTETKCRGFARILRKPSDIRFHAATDWVARESPEVANTLHTCETLAVRVREVLGGASERIAMQWILAIAGHLLGFVDREERPRDRKQELRLVARKRNELAKVEAYYHRAGEKLGRIIYFWGMMSGVVAVAVIGVAAAGLLWMWTGLDPDDATTQNLFASYTMGAVGALVSVMTRMASSKEDTFNLDFEVGRRQLHRLGSFRPFIGAVSALVVFFAMKGDLFQVLPDQKESFYLYAVVAFAAGFSERWANVIFGRAERLLGGDEEGPEEQAKPKPQPATDQRSASV
jgi:hypothetical protein